MAENETEEQARITEMESRLLSKDEELKKANSRLMEMEQSAIGVDSRLRKLDSELKQAVNGYKKLIIRANPDILPELVTGESIEALDNSIAHARELIEKIMYKLTPTGAPARNAPDINSLSPREKIHYAVRKIRI